MGLPQIILLVIYTLGLGMHLNESIGNPKKSIWSALLSYAITMGLLWWGGFFT